MSVENPLFESLKAARLLLRLSQEELGSQVGMRQSQISRIESGAVDARLSTLGEIARALDLEVILVPRRLLPVLRRLIEDAQGGDSTGQKPLYQPSSDSED